MPKDENPGVGHNSEIEISYDDLKSLLDETAQTAKAINEANGAHRSKLKEIIEDQEWNKTAFGDIRKIANMSETKRADFLRTFIPLLDVMRDAVWDNELSDLLDGVDSGDGGD